MKKQTQSQSLGVVSQVRRAFKSGNRLATFVGLLLGGFVPLATYILAHQESGAFSGHERSWALVAGGLTYSAKTVYEWANLAFASMFKAIGFSVLLEGVAISSNTHWLSVAALCYLIGINSVATACNLSLRGAK